MLDYNDMYSYQRRVARTIYEREKLACWMACGLGKTICTLTAAAYLIQRTLVKRVLIVAPKTVTQNVWKQECENWQHTKWLKVSLVVGDTENRLQALQNEAHIYCVSRDNIAWLSGLPDSKNGFLKECDMLVLDESTSFKNRNTMRWKSLCQKGKRKHLLLDQFKRVLLLSGTPASESYEGLWAQIYMLDKGERLDTAITRFREHYMIPELIHNRPIYRTFKPGAIEEIDRKISDLCIAMKAEDYLQLPQRINVIRYTGYVADELYNQMRYEGVITVDNESIMAVDGASRYQKLRELCSGWILDETHNEHYVHSLKENTLNELLEEIGKEQVLIYYQYEFERKFLMLEQGCELIDTPKQQKRWNAGEIKRACANPVSLGYGCNIQKSGCTYMIWYTLPLSYEQYVQACARLHRQGNKNGLTVIHLLSKHTVEESIYDLLMHQKAHLLDALMEYHKIK